MRTLLLFLLLLILNLSIHSQISFEKGYYIDNSNQKINCFIKNIDWKNNPTEFEYYLSDISDSKKSNIELVKEFGIYNFSKYVRDIVSIDRSSNNVDNLSQDKNPLFKEEEIFLKVLVEGKANLYLFEEGNLKRFFYKKDDGKIEQLVYKTYKTKDNKIGKNTTFKNQLWNDLQCSIKESGNIHKLKYDIKELTNFFILYNQCVKEKYITYNKRKKREAFNLNMRLGLNSSSLSITQKNAANAKDTDFANESTFRIGLEAEFIMPYNKNKWSVIIEPNYQSYKSEKKRNLSNISGGVLISKVEYTSIELPLGVRHYFFLNKNSKIFINASIIFDLSPNSLIKLERIDGSEIDNLKIRAGSNFGFGTGYKLNNKYSIEIRYQTPREVLINTKSWESDYKNISLIFGYSLF